MAGKKRAARWQMALSKLDDNQVIEWVLREYAKKTRSQTTRIRVETILMRLKQKQAGFFDDDKQN